MRRRRRRLHGDGRRAAARRWPPHTLAQRELPTQVMARRERQDAHDAAEGLVGSFFAPFLTSFHAFTSASTAA